MLRREGRWIWDSWWVHDGQRHHLFHLWSPDDLGDPDLRHERAGVGHAVSDDLVAWEVLPDALAARPGSWDDVAIWTGCTVRGDDGVWRLFYTALSSRGHGQRDQRIGVALSDDLVTWRRPHDRPIVEVDPRWYRTLDEDPTASETWRDPSVFRDPDGDGWHMVFAARARDGEPGDDGVLGHARSADLEHWQVQPPLSAPGAGFSQLEVPQVREVDGRAVLLFTSHPETQTPARRAAHGAEFCTYVVVADSLVGPWDVASARPFRADPRLFAAPLATHPDGRHALLGFRHLEADGVDPHEITDPYDVELVDGELRVVAAPR